MFLGVHRAGVNIGAEQSIRVLEDRKRWRNQSRVVFPQPEVMVVVGSWIKSAGCAMAGDELVSCADRTDK